MNYALCITNCALRIVHYELCIALCIVHYESSIMNYELYIMNYALSYICTVNKFDVILLQN